MSVRLFIKDTVTGDIHEYGTDQHDSLYVEADGSINYQNLQNGDGTGHGGGYAFCDENGRCAADVTNPDEDFYADIGGDRELVNVPICNEDFGSILICAIRYCLGRRTYMPSTITAFITPMIDRLDKKTLFVMQRDVENCKNYGDPNIDEPYWRQFLEALQTESAKRAQKEKDNSKRGNV